jgi:hypothetical protein
LTANTRVSKAAKMVEYFIPATLRLSPRWLKNFHKGRIDSGNGIAKHVGSAHTGRGYP